MLLQQPDDEKFKELVLFICERSEGDTPFGAIKLNKLLFFVDFVSYSRFGQAVTWHEYRKLQNGPAPRRLMPLVRQLIDEGRAVTVERVYFDKTLKRLVAIKPADVSRFTSREIALATELIRQFWGCDAASMSRTADRYVVHWHALELHETIKYETALARRGGRSEFAETVAIESSDPSHGSIWQVAARRNRAIIFDPLYDRQLAEIEPDFFRADECLSGLLEVLIKNPMLGHRSRRDPDVWYYPLVRDDFPPVFVFYAFDDTRLIFLSIRRLGEGNGHGAH